MKRVDLLIGIVLALAAIGSAIGYVTYEDDRLGSPFLVEWTAEDLALDAVTATQTGAGDVELDFPVDATNLTRIQFNVAIASNAPRVQATQVRIEAFPPGGNESLVEEATLPAGSTSGTAIPLVFDLANLPRVERTTGGSPEDAAARLAAEFASTNGTGEWRFVVSLAPGAPGPVGGAETNTVTIDGTASRYEAEVRPETPEVSRG